MNRNRHVRDRSRSIEIDVEWQIEIATEMAEGDKQRSSKGEDEIGKDKKTEIDR